MRVEPPRIATVIEIDNYNCILSRWSGSRIIENPATDSTDERASFISREPSRTSIFDIDVLSAEREFTDL
jgi:hypothetical protein